MQQLLLDCFAGTGYPQVSTIGQMRRVISCCHNRHLSLQKHRAPWNMFYGWWFQPIWKNMLVKLRSSSQNFRGEKKKNIFELPPPTSRLRFHNPNLYSHPHPNSGPTVTQDSKEFPPLRGKTSPASLWGALLPLHHCLQELLAVSAPGQWVNQEDEGCEPCPLNNGYGMPRMKQFSEETPENSDLTQLWGGLLGKLGISRSGNSAGSNNRPWLCLWAAWQRWHAQKLSH